MNRECIKGRIDAALEKVRARGCAVRSICLTEEDRDALNAALSADFGMKLHAFSYRDHELRPAKRSAVYTTHGVAVAVTRRLSHRVAA